MIRKTNILGIASRVPSLAAIILSALPLVCAAADPSGITIVSPSAGTTVRPGATVTVTVEVEATINPKGVLIMPGTRDLETALIEDVQPPFEGSFVVPKRFIGPLEIRVVVRKNDANETLVDGPSVTITVTPADAPVKLEANLDEPLEYIDGVGTSTMVHVTGIYADGAKRELSGAPFGSSFQTSDSEVAVVDAEGRVQATGIGKAVITVSNSGRTTFVIADVEGAEGQLEPARDMSSSISITASGFRPEPGSPFFFQELTIRNTGTLPLAFPLNLVLSNLPEGVRLENGRGRTSVVTPLGSAVAGIKVNSAKREPYFAPGATATVTLKFTNREGQPITYDARLFQGLRL